MSAPSDKELKKATAEILKVCDISQTSLKAVRKQLEENFGCSLSEQKEVIYGAFEKFLAKNEAVNEYKEIVDAEIKQEAEEAEAEAEAEADLLPTKKKSKGGFGADVHLSADLAAFLGVDVLPRTEVTKRIWVYIKEHDLQDPNDKRLIVCDAELEKVLKRKSVHMFKMTKILSGMMVKPNEVNYGLADGEDDEDESDDEGASKPAKKRVKKEAPSKVSSSKKSATKDSTADKKRKLESSKNGSDDKKAKKQSSYTVSEKLQSLIGVAGDDTRYQVVAKMWEYIRGHSLQNPADKREVQLDKPLQDIFKVKTFTIFSMNKYLSTQIIKNDA